MKRILSVVLALCVLQTSAYAINYQDKYFKPENIIGYGYYNETAYSATDLALRDAIVVHIDRNNTLVRNAKRYISNDNTLMVPLVITEAHICL